MMTRIAAALAKERPAITLDCPKECRAFELKKVRVGLRWQTRTFKVFLGFAVCLYFKPKSSKFIYFVLFFFAPLYNIGRFVFLFSDLFKTPPSVAAWQTTL